MRPWGVLISGNGSNLQCLMDNPEIKMNVVISSKSQAYGLTRARRKGLPVEVVPHQLKGLEAENWILNKLKQYNVVNVFLAGYMKIVSQNFIKQISGNIINIHPSLLPKHKGLNAFEAAVNANDQEFGVSIHHVSEEVDSGKVIYQKKFFEPNKLLLHITEQQALRNIKWGAL